MRTFLGELINIKLKYINVDITQSRQTSSVAIEVIFEKKMPYNSRLNLAIVGLHEMPNTNLLTKSHFLKGSEWKLKKRSKYFVDRVTFTASTYSIYDLDVTSSFSVAYFHFYRKQRLYIHHKNRHFFIHQATNPWPMYDG